MRALRVGLWGFCLVGSVAPAGFLQPRIWNPLSTEQQERLSNAGRPAPWVEREGTGRPVPHGRSEEIPVDGKTERMVV
ncbi:hypothetical protein HNQ79_002581 [Streptomyces candidus]|uniref:Uncharacterized protein n=1 Tax=Streptomyces candidus TaxID=67283 RepID=A0A7X0HH77_9ACTN|nr:hypothetical protein [Streptomyces candidus]